MEREADTLADKNLLKPNLMMQVHYLIALHNIGKQVPKNHRLPASFDKVAYTIANSQKWEPDFIRFLTGREHGILEIVQMLEETGNPDRDEAVMYKNIVAPALMQVQELWQKITLVREELYLALYALGKSTTHVPKLRMNKFTAKIPYPTDNLVDALTIIAEFTDIFAENVPSDEKQGEVALQVAKRIIEGKFSEAGIAIRKAMAAIIGNGYILTEHRKDPNKSQEPAPDETIKTAPAPRAANLGAAAASIVRYVETKIGGEGALKGITLEALAQKVNKVVSDKKSPAEITSDKAGFAKLAYAGWAIRNTAKAGVEIPEKLAVDLLAATGFEMRGVKGENKNLLITAEVPPEGLAIKAFSEGKKANLETALKNFALAATTEVAASRSAALSEMGKVHQINELAA